MVIMKSPNVAKMEGEPAQILYCLLEREHSSYDDGMGALAHVYIKRSTQKIAERDLAKSYQLPGESLEVYIGRLWPTWPARKAFPGYARERNQVLRQMEDRLTNPALSILYHLESTIADELEIRK